MPGLIVARDILEGKGQQWLWDAINKAIDDVYDESEDFYTNNMRFRKVRESLVGDALKSLDIDKYPPRPSATSSPLDSPSFDDLTAILSRAHAPTYVEEDDDPEVMDVLYDSFTGDYSVYWTKKYEEEVYACLIKIIQEHGLDGWRRARWLVYEKVSTILKRSKQQELVIYLFCTSTPNAKWEV